MCLPVLMQDRQVHVLNMRALAVVMQHWYAPSALRCYENNHSAIFGFLDDDVVRDQAIA